MSGFPFGYIQTLLQNYKLLQTIELPLGEDPQINALVSEATAMQLDIDSAVARCIYLEELLALLQSESEKLLVQGAAPAMDSLVALVRCIESLHRMMRRQQTSAPTAYRNSINAMQARVLLVNACKSQSRIVFDHFQSLSERAKNLTERFTELTTDLTYEITLAQERVEGLQNMVQVAETLHTGIENQRESWHEHKTTAEEHVQQARETIHSAESKRDSRESARVVRNILTFGLGEAFDFFDLNEEIDDAERTIASAERNARACEQSIQRAAAAIQQINDEVARLNTLRDTVRAQGMTLQESVKHGQALRTRTIDLTNTSLDISLFVGRLSAKSETLSVHYTAQEFARGVLSFGKLMMEEGRLNGLLVQRDPGALQGALGVIAESCPADDVANNGWVQQRSFVVDDLM